MRHQATLFLLLLTSALSFGALAAWAAGGPAGDGSGSSSSLSSQRWNTVKVSLHGDPLSLSFDKKKNDCPRGVEVGHATCPPHKGVHYDAFTLRKYYSGEGEEEEGGGGEGVRKRKRTTPTASCVSDERDREREREREKTQNLSFFSVFSPLIHKNRRLGHHQDPVGRCLSRQP